MKYITLALGFLAAVASARPAEQRDEQVQTVHLTFHGGPANYEMAFPADGKVYQTSMSPPQLDQTHSHQYFSEASRY